MSKHVLGHNDEYSGGGDDLYSIIFTSEQIHEKLEYAAGVQWSKEQGKLHGEGPRYGCMSESVADLCGEAMSINKVLKQAIMPINACGLHGVFKSIPTFLCRSVFPRTEAVFDR